MARKLESEFQPVLKKRLENEFPGCMVIKQDSGMIQGIPDLLVLFEDKWAILETKRGVKADKQPNQEYYVDKLNEMSYSAFVNPDNIDEVFIDLHETFRSDR